MQISEQNFRISITNKSKCKALRTSDNFSFVYLLVLHCSALGSNIFVTLVFNCAFSKQEIASGFLLFGKEIFLMWK